MSSADILDPIIDIWWFVTIWYCGFYAQSGKSASKSSEMSMLSWAVMHVFVTPLIIFFWEHDHAIFEYKSPTGYKNCSRTPKSCQVDKDSKSNFSPKTNSTDGQDQASLVLGACVLSSSCEA